MFSIGIGIEIFIMVFISIPYLPFLGNKYITKEWSVLDCSIGGNCTNVRGTEYKFICNGAGFEKINGSCYYEGNKVSWIGQGSEHCLEDGGCYNLYDIYIDENLTKIRDYANGFMEESIDSLYK